VNDLDWSGLEAEGELFMDPSEEGPTPPPRGREEERLPGLVGRELGGEKEGEVDMGGWPWKVNIELEDEAGFLDEKVVVVEANGGVGCGGRGGAEGVGTDKRGDREQISRGSKDQRRLETKKLELTRWEHRLSMKIDAKLDLSILLFDRLDVDVEYYKKEWEVSRPSGGVYHSPDRRRTENSRDPAYPTVVLYSRCFSLSWSTPQNSTENLNGSNLVQTPFISLSSSPARPISLASRRSSTIPRPFRRVGPRPKKSLSPVLEDAFFPPKPEAALPVAAGVWVSAWGMGLIGAGLTREGSFGLVEDEEVEGSGIKPPYSPHREVSSVATGQNVLSIGVLESPESSPPPPPPPPTGRLLLPLPLYDDAPEEGSRPCPPSGANVGLPNGDPETQEDEAAVESWGEYGLPLPPRRLLDWLPLRDLDRFLAPGERAFLSNARSAFSSARMIWARIRSVLVVMPSSGERGEAPSVLGAGEEGGGEERASREAEEEGIEAIDVEARILDLSSEVCQRHTWSVWSGAKGRDVRGLMSEEMNESWSKERCV
jgi:hypothetical protein